MSKIVRLGMTESGLLFLNWVYKHVKLNEGEKTNYYETNYEFNQLVI